MPARTFLSVLSDDLPRSRDWYVKLFGYAVAFDSDWFVHLRAPQNDTVELGILRRDHDVVPEALRTTPSGGLLSIVVEDVDATHALAQRLGVEIVEAPTDQFYGQRRMVVRDPDGVALDVSSPCAPDPDWLASLDP